MYSYCCRKQHGVVMVRPGGDFTSKDSTAAFLSIEKAVLQRVFHYITLNVSQYHMFSISIYIFNININFQYQYYFSISISIFDINIYFQYQYQFSISILIFNININFQYHY